jgi:hypothetical protein
MFQRQREERERQKQNEEREREIQRKQLEFQRKLDDNYIRDSGDYGYQVLSMLNINVIMNRLKIVTNKFFS